MWWDNSCEKKPLAILCQDRVHINNAKVMDYIDGDNWNMDKLREDLLNILSYILLTFLFEILMIMTTLFGT